MKRNRINRTARLVTILTAVLCALPAASHAELTLDWWTVDSGGCTRLESGTITLGGTAAQPDAGPLSDGATMALVGGFWNRGSSATGIAGDEAPRAFRMHAAVPNPFNPRTTVAFDLPEAGRCRLKIYDLRGRFVRALVDESLPAGAYAFDWDGRNQSGVAVGSGIYLMGLWAGPHRAVQKVVLLK